MPPRKRARVAQAESPTRQMKTPDPAADSPGRLTDEAILNDPWTDEEEIGLFKGLIKWKPTGLHKHFRMLQLRDYLLENDYIHARAEHTQIAGIWQKLESLYDLEALDQREDARQLSDLSDDSDNEDEEEANDDVYSLAENKVHKQAFELPEDEYGDKMWKQRLPDHEQEREESPLMLPELNMTTQAPITFTPSFSIEPEDHVIPPIRPRGRPRGSTRGKAAASATAARRSRRQAESVATESEDAGSVAAKSEEQEATEDEDSEVVKEENDDDNEDDDDDDEEAEASEASAPTTTTTRVRGGRSRGRGAGRGRPRGRRR